MTVADLIRAEGREPGGLPPKGKWYRASAWLYVPPGTGHPSFRLTLNGHKGASVYMDAPTIGAGGKR